jgi:DNA-binding transcriptional ArsR family regulator
LKPSNDIGRTDAGHGRKFGDRRSYPIPVWNGVFEHRARIGEALWEFLWCIDAITSESNEVGLVHGGAPVKIERIAKDLKGADKETVRRHLRKLVQAGYVRMRRTPYGQVIHVLNSKKFGIWKGKEKPQKTVSPTQEKPQKTVSQPGEKHTGVDEKLHFAVNKEDTAVTLQDDSTRQSPGVGFDFETNGSNKKISSSSGSKPDDIIFAVQSSPNVQPNGKPIPEQERRMERLKLEAREIIAREFPDETSETITAVLNVIVARATTNPRSASFLVTSFRNEAEDCRAKGARLEFYALLARLHRGVQERASRRHAT